MPQLPIDAGKIKTRSVQNRNHLPRSGAQKVLIALGEAVEVETIGGLGKKGLRLHLRIHRLAEDFVEGQPEEKRTQVVDVGDSPEAVESSSGVQSRVFTAFLEGRRADAAINHSKIVQIDIGSFAGTGAKLSALRPAAQGKIFGADGGIHHAIDGPVVSVAQDIAFGGRTAHRRNQKSRLTGLLLDRMGGEGEIEDWEPVQDKFAAIDLGVAAHVHIHLARIELPLGMGQFASRNGAVVDEVVSGTRFLYQFAGKGKGSSGSEDGPVGPEAQASRSRHIVKLSRFQSEVISAMRGANVIVVGTAVQGKMSAG